MADARVDRHRTVQLNSRFFDRERAAARCAALVEKCVADLAAQGHTDVVIARSVEMRYLGQNYELEFPIDIDVFTEEEVAASVRAFHERTRRASASGSTTISRSSISSSPASPTPASSVFRKSAAPRRPRRRSRSARSGSRSGWVETPVYSRDRSAQRPCRSPDPRSSKKALGHGARPWQVPDRRSLRQSVDLALTRTEEHAQWTWSR